MIRSNPVFDWLIDLIKILATFTDWLIWLKFLQHLHTKDFEMMGFQGFSWLVQKLIWSNSVLDWLINLIKTLDAGSTHKGLEMMRFWGKLISGSSRICVYMLLTRVCVLQHSRCLQSFDRCMQRLDRRNLSTNYYNWSFSCFVQFYY